MRWMMVFLAVSLMGLGCKDRQQELLAGCSKDEHCPEGMVCKKRECVKPEEPKAKPKKKAPPEPLGDMKVRICPAYYNTSSNTGTLIATHRETGKKKYFALGQNTEGSHQYDYVIKDLPPGDHDVVMKLGVVSGGQVDLQDVKCGIEVECKDEKIRPIVVYERGKEPPPPEPEKKPKKAKNKANPRASDRPPGPPCDFDINL